MDQNQLEKLARTIVKDLDTDIRDRCGLGNEWEAIDTDIRKEIMDGWAAAIVKRIQDPKFRTATAGAPALPDIDTHGGQK